MAQLASYKVPFDELRGKLATKQSGITYSGQESGTNPDTLTIGSKHTATNFSKYIVAYKRRGVNRFFVKSATSVRQTTLSRSQKARIALGSGLADYVLYTCKSELTYNDFIASLYNAYINETGNTNLTIREFLIGQFMSQIPGLTLLGFTLPDYRTTGVYTKVAVINYGFNNIDAQACLDDSTTVGNTLAYYILNNTDYMRTKGFGNSLRAYMSLYYGTTTIQVSMEGVVKTVLIPIARNHFQYTSIFASVIGFELDANQGDSQLLQMYLFNADTLKMIGTDKYTLYPDSSLGSALTVADELPSLVYV